MIVKMKLDSLTKNYAKYAQPNGINKWYLPKADFVNYPDNLPPEEMEVELKGVPRATTS